MIKPTIKAINKIRKEYNIPKNASIPAHLYRKALEESTSNSRRDFRFEFELIELSHNRVHVRVIGNHLSKNVVDSLSRRDNIRYKNAFKIAAKAFYLKNHKKIRSFKRIEKGEIYFIFYSKHSRDHDNNSENIKRVQDNIVRLGFVVDDKRENLTSKKEPEEILIKKTEKPAIECIIERVK